MTMTYSSLPEQSDLMIGDVMSKPVLTVEMNESLWDAWQLLFVSGLRHLVVIDQDSHCVGVLSDRNILADVPATMDHLGNRHVREILARVPTATIGPNARPDDAARVMREHSIEAVPVVDENGRVLGIITESDVVRWVGR
jgi:CBS-domain-containing membrane protein